MNDWFSLLTWLPWRFGFNSSGLKSICAVSSSAVVRHLRGEFDWIQRLIMTNPASVTSRSSLNVGELWWTQDLAIKFRNCFMIQSRIKRRREYINFYKEFPGKKRWPFDLMKIGWTSTIVRVGWATIPWLGSTFSRFFARLILIGPSWCIHASSTIAKIAIASRASYSQLTGSTVSIFAHAFDVDQVECSLRDQCISLLAIASNASHNATRPAFKISREHSPTQKKRGKGEYINWGEITHLCYCPNTLTRAH